MLSLPAIAEEPIAAYDPRQVGEALWPDEFPLEFLLKQRAQSAYDFAALYQQRPAPVEGALLKREWLTQLVDVVPAQAKRIRYWDKAGTEGGGAYTAGVLLALHEGLYYLEDVIRGQWSALQREQVIRQTAELDAQRYGKWAVAVYFEQEPGSGGKESAQNTLRNLAGFEVHADKPVTNKDARLKPFAAQAEAGNVRLKRADWNFAFIEEATAVPHGTYRDQTDAAGGAFNKLSEPVQRPLHVPFSGLYKSCDGGRERIKYR